MTHEIINLPIEGTRDIFGIELRKHDFLFRKFTDVIHRYGYEQIEVPLIERGSSFSEEVVGESPWPEWDKRGCFYLKINNYRGSFTEIYESIDALLIPEGTVSVTRWLGNYLSSAMDFALPLKIFYKLPCFRNELIDSLSESKRRQFSQFGIEILGSNALPADVEIIYLIKRLLEEVGVDSNQIKVRISNVGIFNFLKEDCGLSNSDSIELKEAMDTIAECRAGKKPERYSSNEEKFFTTLGKYSITEAQRLVWETILKHDSGVITPNMYEIFPLSCRHFLDELIAVNNALLKNNVNAIIDLCVVRSHEYYTGISFEVDVVSSEYKFIEIAGGGRYDKLVSNFHSTKTIIPSTGFAFGLERVAEMLDKLGKFEHTISIDSIISFEDSSADKLIMLKQDDQLEAYFNAVKEIESYKETRFDVYFGENGKERTYMKQKQIKNIVTI